MIKDYILWNWTLILVLLGFAVSLRETVFLDKITIRRYYALIITIFLLSIDVYGEFYLTDLGGHVTSRLILMAIRYSATPYIVALVIYTLTKKVRWFIFIPAIVLGIIDALSVINGLVFSIGADDTLHRGPLGYLPYIVVGFYSVFLIYILIKRSNKQIMEMIPIAFLGFAFGSGLVLPFIYGKDYSHIFCSTIAVALYVYYVFSILQLTKKDSLTGLLNRQAYYADVENDPENISGLISIDMDGLKDINDNYGHAAGDEALSSLALSFQEMFKLVEELRKNVEETAYHCSIGCAHISDGADSIDALLQQSDEKMYKEKAEYYQNAARDRRSR